jgi:hypothetical protein
MTLTSPRPVDVGAWINELESTRTMRMQRHLAVATLAVAALAVFRPNPDSLSGFALIPILVAVTLSSLARGANARFGYMWGWIYREPSRKTRIDRFVDGVIHHLAGVPDIVDLDEDQRVRFLDDAEFTAALRIFPTDEDPIP